MRTHMLMHMPHETCGRRSVTDGFVENDKRRTLRKKKIKITR